MGKSITDLSSVTTVGLDLAKHFFKSMALTLRGGFVVAKAIRRNKLLEFFASLLSISVSIWDWRTSRNQSVAGNESRYVFGFN